MAPEAAAILVGVGGDGAEGVGGSGDGVVDVCGGVDGGDEGGFELGRREEDAAVEHFAEEAGVALGVGALGARRSRGRVGR